MLLLDSIKYYNKNRVKTSLSMLYNTYMSTICLSAIANIRIKNYLIENGHKLIEIKKTGAVYDAVSSHADIYLCNLKNGLVVAGEQLQHIKELLLQYEVSFSVGNSHLSCKYPGNIPFNATQIGGYLVHNINYTDQAILRKANEAGLKPLHVKQGYTKCSLAVVDDNSVITSDRGIAAVLTEHGLNVLLISTGHVRLEGFPYGFIGGATGRVHNEIIFNGDLSSHPDFLKIMEFIEQRKLRPVYFKEYPLEDIGSVIQL